VLLLCFGAAGAITNDDQGWQWGTPPPWFANNYASELDLIDRGDTLETIQHEVIEIATHLHSGDTLETIQHEVIEIATHLHSNEWLGALAASPSPPGHAAEWNTMNPFQSTAGNDTWGAWIQIIGSTDTPIHTGMTKFDLHKILVIDVAVTADLDLHIVQVGCGLNGAQTLIDSTYTTFAFVPERGAAVTVINFQMKRCEAGQNVWLRHWVDGTNAPTMDFVHLLHEYDE